MTPPMIRIHPLVLIALVLLFSGGLAGLVSPALAEPTEPIALRSLENATSLQALRSFEVESWHPPYSTMEKSLRGELTEQVRRALLAETALPKASPAQGRLVVACVDPSAVCSVVEAVVRSGGIGGPVIWRRQFDNSTWSGDWQWFVFKGWRRPEAMAAEIVAALKADYTAGAAE